jgi:hypothetical protein
LGHVPRLDERLAAVQWQATLDAESLPAISQTLRVARIPGFGVAPTLRVFVEIRGAEVVFRSIEIIAEVESA